MKIISTSLLKRGAIALAALLLSALVALYLLNGRMGIGGDLANSAALAGSPAALKSPLTLKVATFNIQDLYLASGDRPLRMRGIGARLMVLDPDIVGFQEAFIASDREILLKELATTRLRHHQYYPSATVGSGLFIVSAFPIKEVFFHRFTHSGPFYRVWEGDWWAGKGVALARLELPDGQGLLDFYTTHAQASYGNPAYGGVRIRQMAELGDFVQRSRIPEGPAVLVGDLNCEPGDPEYAVAIEGARMMRAMEGDSRVDHIFAAAGAGHTVHVIKTEPIEATVKLGERELSLSDHTGYLSTIEIRPAGGETQE